MKNRWLIVVLAALLAGLLLYAASDDSDDATSTDVGDDDGTGAYSDDSATTTTTASLGGGILNTVGNFLSRWAHAIAPAENVNASYNNPGGLNTAGDLGSTPAAGGTGHDVIGIFSTLALGYQALENTLASYVRKYPNKTLLQATAIYVMGPNDPRTISGNFPASVVHEAERVAAGLGASINDTLASLAAA